MSFYGDLSNNAELIQSSLGIQYTGSRRREWSRDVPDLTLKAKKRSGREELEAWTISPEGSTTSAETRVSISRPN